MKKVSLLLSLLFLAVCLFAQDSTVVSIPVGGGVMALITAHLAATITIVLAVYEVAARLIPTIKNYSIISFIVKILNQLVPNKKEVPNSSLTTKHID